MPDSFTENYGFTLPEIGGSPETWGNKINENWSRIDELLTARLAQIDAAIDTTTANYRAWIDARIGEISWRAASDIPDNVLIPKGQLVSRSDYPKLFAAIGTTFNTGNESSSQFRLPAVQDRYIRATQTGNATGLGELLDDTIGAHDHEASIGAAGRHKHTGTTQENGQHKHTGTTNTTGKHSHGVYQGRSGSHTGTDSEEVRSGDSTYRTTEDGDHSHMFTSSQQAAHTHGFITSEQPDHTHTVTVKEAGDSETRPKTIRFIPIIYCDWE